MVILGISIGTRTSGIAIINHKGLITWNTISFKNSWSERKSEQIIRKYEKYLKAHKVTVLVLKVPRISHHTDAIKSLLEKIQSIISYHGCMVQYTTQADIKAAIPNIKNSHDLINHTATLYPILIHEQRRELGNRNKYHDKMFEAVLVAHLSKSTHDTPKISSE